MRIVDALLIVSMIVLWIVALAGPYGARRTYQPAALLSPRGQRALGRLEHRHLLLSIPVVPATVAVVAYPLYEYLTGAANPWLTTGPILHLLALAYVWLVLLYLGAGLGATRLRRCGRLR